MKVVVDVGSREAGDRLITLLKHLGYTARLDGGVLCIAHHTFLRRMAVKGWAVYTRRAFTKGTRTAVS